VYTLAIINKCLSSFAIKQEVNRIGWLRVIATTICCWRIGSRQNRDIQDSSESENYHMVDPFFEEHIQNAGMLSYKSNSFFENSNPRNF